MILVFLDLDDAAFIEPQQTYGGSYSQHSMISGVQDLHSNYEQRIPEPGNSVRGLISRYSIDADLEPTLSPGSMDRAGPSRVV
jgi:hypothetical protein